jgi:hypothetical protein
MDELQPRAPHNLVAAGGAMSDHLAGAAGLVTMSSTAAIEAIALWVPVIIVDDFGVSAELINTVFEDSGLFGNCGDLVEGRFHHPNEAWLDDNYFHGAEQNDWVRQVDELLATRTTGNLPLKPLRHGDFGGVLRPAEGPQAGPRPVRPVVERYGRSRGGRAHALGGGWSFAAHAAVALVLGWRTRRQSGTMTAVAQPGARASSGVPSGIRTNIQGLRAVAAPYLSAG